MTDHAYGRGSGDRTRDPGADTRSSCTGRGRRWDARSRLSFLADDVEARGRRWRSGGVEFIRTRRRIVGTRPASRTRRDTLCCRRSRGSRVAKPVRVRDIIGGVRLVPRTRGPGGGEETDDPGYLAPLSDELRRRKLLHVPRDLFLGKHHDGGVLGGPRHKSAISLDRVDFEGSHAVTGGSRSGRDRHRRSGIAAAMKGNLPILDGLDPLVRSFCSRSPGSSSGVGAPLQRRIATSRAKRIPPHGVGFHHALYKRWGLWGLVALIAPAIAMANGVEPSLRVCNARRAVRFHGSILATCRERHQRRLSCGLEIHGRAIILLFPGPFLRFSFSSTPATGSPKTGYDFTCCLEDEE